MDHEPSQPEETQAVKVHTGHEISNTNQHESDNSLSISELKHLAKCLVVNSPSTGDNLPLLEKLSISSGLRLPRDELSQILEEFKTSNTDRDRSLSLLVREFVMSTDGYFFSSEIHRHLKLSTRRDKKNVSTILGRMLANGTIERYGQKNGCYRKIDSDCIKMNFLSAEHETIDLSLPFGMSDKVLIMPGNIILVAGEPNSGKTALLLNIIKDNMNQFEIHYFNSEMGASELKRRLSNFEGMRLEDWCFSPWERSHNFADVVKPGKNKVNIIDFLEIHDNFYEIGGKLAKIHDRLEGAIGIVAIQKNKGTDLGLGGYRTLEKPRLALALSPGTLKIVKAKNLKIQANPSGQQVRFNLINGCELELIKDWHFDFNN